jgi:hypothetical protein
MNDYRPSATPDLIEFVENPVFVVRREVARGVYGNVPEPGKVEIVKRTEERD